MGFRKTSTPSTKKGQASSLWLEDVDDALVKQAMRHARRNNISTCPLDVEGLAEHLGAKISRVSSLPEGVIGRVEINKSDNNKCKIKINNKYPESKKRFTVAHELGHFLKHNVWQSGDLLEEHVGNVVQHLRSQSSGGLEWEANSFAAQLLMPAVDVAREFTHEKDVAELAKKFGVSKAAMTIRVEKLKLE